MDEPICITYSWTVAELLAAQKYHNRQALRPVFRWLLLGFLLLIVCAMLAHLANTWRDGTFDPLVVYFFLPVVLLVLSLPWLIPWRVRRAFCQRPDRDQIVEWKIDENRLAVTTPDANSEFSWRNIVRVVECPRGFLLYQLPTVFQWLPRTGFKSERDLERLACLAHRMVADYRVLR